MIRKIKGTLCEVDTNLGLIETNSGVFYEVRLTDSILTSHVPPCEIEVYTYLQVREDALNLFGFKDNSEYKIFLLLLGVPGVGPKTAFGLISKVEIDDFISAVQSNNLSFFSKIPGLGKKTSLKIILELSEKFNSEFKFNQTKLSESDKDIVDALKSLGFKVENFDNILSKLDVEKSTEARITDAIRILSSNNRN